MDNNSENNSEMFYSFDNNNEWSIVLPENPADMSNIIKPENVEKL